MNENEKDSILTTRGLKFLDVISYPDINIPEGGMIFVVGESGSGKSTLLKLFNYTYTPTEGEIRYRSQPTLEIDTVELRRNVLLVSQSVFLFDDTIRINFDKFYDYRGLPHLSDEDKRYFMKLARASFDLDDHSDNMSGGERQRVYLAICLSFKPDVLMLDEPTAALDHQTAFSLFENLKKFTKDNGITLIVISHDKSLINEFAEDVISVER